MGAVSFLVPVIKVKVMKEGAGDQRLRVRAQPELFVDKIAESHHVHHVIVGADSAVLAECLHGLGFLGMDVFMKIGVNLFQFRRG